MPSLYSKLFCSDEYCKATNFILGWFAISAAIISFVNQQPIIAWLTMLALPKLWHTQFQAYEDRLHNMIKMKHRYVTPSAIIKRCYFAIVGSGIILPAVALEIVTLKKVKIFLLHYISATQYIIV